MADDSSSDDSSDDSDTGGDNGWSSDNDQSAADPGSVSDSGKGGNDATDTAGWGGTGFGPNGGTFGSFTDNGQQFGGWDTGKGGIDWSYNDKGTEAALYGTYSGWDFGSYGWGDPNTGYQDTPDAANEAYTQIAAQQQAAAFQSLMDQWSVKDDRDPEQQFQDQQEADNIAGTNSYTQGASPAAVAEYNNLGFEGALTGTPWSYTDLNGQTNTNYGSIGHDALSALGSFGSVAGALTGYGELGMALSGISNAALGNIGSVTGLLGSLFGGTIGGGFGSVLGNLLSGKEESAAKSAVNTGLTASGLSLGSLMNGITGSKDALTNVATNFASNYAQNAAINSALNSMGINNSGSMTNGLSGMLSSGSASNSSSNNGVKYE